MASLLLYILLYAGGAVFPAGCIVRMVGRATPPGTTRAVAEDPCRD